MECALCIQKIKYPVGASQEATPHHLMALCRYLAKQLLNQSDHADPALLDMTNRDVQHILQLKVGGRTIHFFPQTIEVLEREDICSDWKTGDSSRQKELTLRIARAFINSKTNEEGLHVLSKKEMIQIRNKLVREENPDPDDECWLRSLVGSFSGMGAGGWAVLTGTLALTAIAGREVWRSLMPGIKRDEDCEAPTTMIENPNRFISVIEAQV